jgi:integrase
MPDVMMSMWTDAPQLEAANLRFERSGRTSRWAGKVISYPQRNDGYGADSGPSRYARFPPAALLRAGVVGAAAVGKHETANPPTGHSGQQEDKVGYSEFDPAIRERRPWNAGRMVGAKRALKPQQVWAIRFWLDRERRLRDRALFDLAIDSKLRGCDVVKIRIRELVSGGRVRGRATVTQQKTGRPVQFELLEAARSSLQAWLECRGRTIEDYAFPSRTNHARHTGTRQYARLVDEWVTAIGLRHEDYGTHSLRRTKASIIDKATGNLRAVQLLLGHTKIESTVRYLGVDVEDALTLAEHTEV